MHRFFSSYSFHLVPVKTPSSFTSLESLSASEKTTISDHPITSTRPSTGLGLLVTSVPPAPVSTWFTVGTRKMFLLDHCLFPITVPPTTPLCESPFLQEVQKRNPLLPRAASPQANGHPQSHPPDQGALEPAHWSAPSLTLISGSYLTVTESTNVLSLNLAMALQCQKNKSKLKGFKDSTLLFGFSLPTPGYFVT